MARRKTFKGLRGLIAEARDFRAGSKNQDYLEIRMAKALETLLDEQDAQSFEYFVMFARTGSEPHRGPWSEFEVDAFIRESEEDGLKPGVFVKARRSVGRIQHLT